MLAISRQIYSPIAVNDSLDSYCTVIDACEVMTKKQVIARSRTARAKVCRKREKCAFLGPLPLHVVRENRRDFSLGRLSVVDLWWVQVGGARGFGGAEGERGEKIMTQF